MCTSEARQNSHVYKQSTMLNPLVRHDYHGSQNVLYQQLTCTLLLLRSMVACAPAQNDAVSIGTLISHVCFHDLFCTMRQNHMFTKAISASSPHRNRMVAAATHKHTHTHTHTDTRLPCEALSAPSHDLNIITVANACMLHVLQSESNRQTVTSIHTVGNDTAVHG